MNWLMCLACYGASCISNHIIYFSQVVEGSGNVSVLMLQYANPSGELANGECCDGRLGMCLGECDYEFTLCLDVITR